MYDRGCGSTPAGGGASGKIFLFPRVDAGSWPQPVTSDNATDDENELIILLSYVIYIAAGIT
jgi:hypothetical protein